MRVIHAAIAAVVLGIAAVGCAEQTATGGSSTASATQNFDKPGFAAVVHDGRLWVFKAGSKELGEFTKHKDLREMVTRVGAGPNKMTIRAPDVATLDAYLAAK
ncbi:MAG: hypothetical protein ACKVSF_07725 [Alphaproteobacteria bacterium]